MESLENFKKKLLQRKEKLKEVEEKRDKLKVECLDLQALCEKLTSKNTEYGFNFVYNHYLLKASSKHSFF
jgi:hypothetical protein